MSDTEEIICEEARRYPYMEPQDVVKLIYQNEFGAGHFVKDEEQSMERLLEEYYRVCHDKDLPLFERIGNGYVRCNFDSIKMKEELLPYLNGSFLLSAREGQGTKESFQRKLALLCRQAEKGLFRFGEAQLRSYLSSYEKAGFPIVSHSENYRKVYGPSYRVIRERFVRLFPLMEAVGELLRYKKQVTVALDGRCAAGKTTAAADLAGIFQGQVIHMDDFFLPQELRTKERYEEAGGNVHYERFRAEVIEKLQRQNSFSYRVFDCKRMDYNGERNISGGGLLLVEGAYSMHRFFGQPYDLTAFFDIEKEEQKKRIIARNGEASYKSFKERWIPLEEKYLDEQDIGRRCRFVVK